jgi:hypothetical protein
MKSGKKLTILTLVIILTTTALTFSCQADVNGTAQGQRLGIRAPSDVMEGQSFVISVTANGKPVYHAQVTLGWGICCYTDKNGEVFARAPEVNYNIQFSITANMLGYIPASTLITVINLPVPTSTARPVPTF